MTERWLTRQCAGVTCQTGWAPSSQWQLRGQLGLRGEFYLEFSLNFKSATSLTTGWSSHLSASWTGQVCLNWEFKLGTRRVGWEPIFHIYDCSSKWSSVSALWIWIPKRIYLPYICIHDTDSFSWTWWSSVSGLRIWLEGAQRVSLASSSTHESFSCCSSLSHIPYMTSAQHYLK